MSRAPVNEKRFYVMRVDGGQASAAWGSLFVSVPRAPPPLYPWLHRPPAACSSLLCSLLGLVWPALMSLPVLCPESFLQNPQMAAPDTLSLWLLREAFPDSRDPQRLPRLLPRLHRSPDLSLLWSCVTFWNHPTLSLPSTVFFLSPLAEGKVL